MPETWGRVPLDSVRGFFQRERWLCPLMSSDHRSLWAGKLPAVAHSLALFLLSSAWVTVASAQEASPAAAPTAAKTAAPDGSSPPLSAEKQTRFLESLRVPRIVPGLFVAIDEVACKTTGWAGSKKNTSANYGMTMAYHQDYGRSGGLWLRASFGLGFAPGPLGYTVNSDQSITNSKTHEGYSLYLDSRLDGGNSFNLGILPAALVQWEAYAGLSLWAQHRNYTSNTLSYKERAVEFSDFTAAGVGAELGILTVQDSPLDITMLHLELGVDLAQGTPVSRVMFGVSYHFPFKKTRPPPERTSDRRPG